MIRQLCYLYLLSPHQTRLNKLFNRVTHFQSPADLHLAICSSVRLYFMLNLALMLYGNIQLGLLSCLIVSRKYLCLEWACPLDISIFDTDTFLVLDIDEPVERNNCH